MNNCQGPLKVAQIQTHAHTLSPWFVPLPTSSAAYGVSAGVRQCQLPPSASQWGPASRHLSGQLSLLSTLHCTTLCQASTQDREPHMHASIKTHQNTMGRVFIVFKQKGFHEWFNQVMQTTELLRRQKTAVK